jgi:hypothetical protein
LAKVFVEVVTEFPFAKICNSRKSQAQLDVIFIFPLFLREMLIVSVVVNFLIVNETL